VEKSLPIRALRFREVSDLADMGIITGEEGDALVSGAAKSDVGKMEEGIRKVRK